MAVPTISQLMDLFRETMPTLPKPSTQYDEEDRWIHEREKDANDTLRYDFVLALRTVLKTIYADDPKPLLDKFNFLAPLFKPCQVEYLAAFLEGFLIPRGVNFMSKQIRRIGQERIRMGIAAWKSPVQLETGRGAKSPV